MYLAGTKTGQPQQEFPNDTFAQKLIDELLNEKKWSRYLTLQPLYDPGSDPDVVKLVIGHKELPDSIEPLVIEVRKNDRLEVADIRARVRAFIEAGKRKCQEAQNKAVGDLSTMQALSYQVDEIREPKRASRMEQEMT